MAILKLKEIRKLSYAEQARMVRKMWKIYEEHPTDCPCEMCKEWRGHAEDLESSVILYNQTIPVT